MPLLFAHLGVRWTRSITLREWVNAAYFQQPPHREWLWKKSFLSIYLHGFFREGLKREVALSAQQMRMKVRRCPVGVWQGEEENAGEEGLTEQPWDRHSPHLPVFSAVRKGTRLSGPQGLLSSECLNSRYQRGLHCPGGLLPGLLCSTWVSFMTQTGRRQAH